MRPGINDSHILYGTLPIHLKKKNHVDVTQFQVFLEIGRPLTRYGSVPFCIVYLEENLPVPTRSQTGMEYKSIEG